MKNPYEILEVSQDVTTPQIMKAMATALRKRKHSNTDVAQASAQLRNPATRLAADFTFPIFESYDNMEPLVAALQPEIIDINSINADEYNSL